jgi:multicomponent Na+:H+ antiporter subunit G
VNPVAAVLLLTGSALAVLAGVGLIRLRTPYARFHAAGKASPIAFLVAALGAAIESGPAEAARLAVAATALVLTLPIGVHLLFRAVHRTDRRHRPTVDELADGADGSRPGPSGPTRAGE